MSPTPAERRYAGISRSRTPNRTRRCEDCGRTANHTDTATGTHLCDPCADRLVRARCRQQHETMHPGMAAGWDA